MTHGFYFILKIWVGGDIGDCDKSNRVPDGQHAESSTNHLGKFLLKLVHLCKNHIQMKQKGYSAKAG